MTSVEVERLKRFIKEQKRHWKRLKTGLVPDKNIIQGWIESCDFAREDLDEIVKGR